MFMTDMKYVTSKSNDNVNVEQFNNGVTQLVFTNKIHEELLDIFNSYFNIIIIDLEYNEMDLACPFGLNANNGLYYIVYAETFPNFKNTYSFIKNEKVADNFGICYNMFYNHDLAQIKTLNNKTELSFSLMRLGDCIRHFKILNEFETNYDYQIMIGYGANYELIGNYNTNDTNKVILRKYINMLGSISMNHGVNVKIIVDTKHRDDWKYLKMLCGYVFFGSDTYKKLNSMKDLYI